MQLHSFRSSYNIFVLFGIFILTIKNLGGCNPITNSNFNENIREFSLKEDNTNTSNIKTLQKEDPKRYTELSYFRPINLQDIPDNKLAGSSHSRGLINRDHPGYPIHDYDEYSHIGYGYEYSVPHVHNEYHHQIEPFHYGDHGSVGHHYSGPHYKHYNHALAAKAVLWPIAGIALLGAAAALVSNPILLQLGVASGKRKRRETEEITGPDLDVDYKIWKPHIEDIPNHATKVNDKSLNRIHFQRKTLKNKEIKSKRPSMNKHPIQSFRDFEFNAPISNESNDMNLVRVPMQNV
ncbi:uncharacterized protein LOC126769351 [Nymphalis io]|uniref:uncharacterized protein LOC126769351 n=1 Tax=Inachis io TaxID=171585 RepID=UPI00216814B7|nr:uncharacterized protein LOC126769351 [Nymphalis io]